MNTLSSQSIRSFRQKVWSYYRKHKRDFPWRHTTDPYQILVSEVMLQQTQAERVVAKYRDFIRQFPTAKSLAKAPFPRVLTAWQGLGYNRRALFLVRAAKLITQHGFPSTRETLEELPGIGPYTAGAIETFAYDRPHLFLETNIRTALIHHFFNTKKKVHDAELESVLQQSLPSKHFREWYSALMDYGAMLKRTVGNASRKSTTYVKQSVFQGSDRQIRGKLIAALLTGPQTRAALNVQFPTISKQRLEMILSKLRKEALVEMRGRYVVLPGVFKKRR